MSSYNDTLRKHRRLSILRFLKDCAMYSSNASILEDVLNGMAVTSTRSQIITEIAWLSEQGFVTYEDRNDFVVVTATPSGVEIATGQATHPDIQRPGAVG